MNDLVLTASVISKCSDGEWHCIVQMVDGAKVRVYLDGIPLP